MADGILIRKTGCQELQTEEIMSKVKSRIACGVLAAALVSGCLAGCGKLDGTKTVATVDGESVTLGLASYLVRDQQAQTESYYQMLTQSYGMDVSGELWDREGEDGKTYGENAKDDVMDTIKTLYVLKAHAEEYGVTISEEDQAKIEEAAKAFMEANEKSVLEELAVSESDLVTYLELMTYRQRMREPMVADVDQEVSDEEANQTRITMVQVSTAGTEQDEDGNTIDLTDEEKAEKKEVAENILEKIAESDNPAEADVSALAQEVDDSASVTTPAFTTAGSEDDTLDQSVIDAALELEEGEVAPEVIEGEDAYFVVRLDKMYDEEATENKKASIISEREQEAYDKLLEEWEEAAEMKVEESVWKKIKVTDSKSFTYKAEEQTTDEDTSAGTDAADETAEDDPAGEGDGSDAAENENTDGDAAEE